MKPTNNEPFRPTAKIDTLRTRSAIIRRIRDFFDSRGFFHVETPLLSADTVIDRYLDPIPVDSRRVGGNRDLPERLYLQTSPEFSMKRLLAGGADSIYQIGPAFRHGESGRLHNPEFTMLEWYETGQSVEEAIRFLGDLVEHVTGMSGTRSCPYEQVFQHAFEINPHTCDPDDLRAIADKNGIDIAAGSEMDRDQWLNLLLTHVIEPDLGRPEPLVVYDWPASQAALAIVREDNPPVAERFELYIDGIEIANGYHELLDADELRKRNDENNRQRIADGNEALPVNSRLLEAMEHGLPGCCGVALGVDRLVMVALGAKHIRDVIAFPIDRA